MKWRRFLKACSKLTCVFVDLETGGIDYVSPGRHAVLMVGAVSVHRGRIVDSVEFGVTPYEGSEISQEAINVNGWPGESDLDVDEHTALELLSNLWATHPSRSNWIPIAGHFVSIDERWLCAMARRTGYQWPPERFGRRAIDSCTMSLPLNLMGEFRSLSLDRMCDTLGISGRLSRAELGHRSARADCLASLAVVYEVLWRLS